MLSVSCDKICGPIRRNGHRVRRAFTLIELLVVISIMAIFIGLIGHLGSGTETNGLQAAQGMISGLLTAARAQAALAPGGYARVLVAADPTDQKKNLHFLRVVVVDPDDDSFKNPATPPTKWITVGGAELYLPNNIFVVPPKQDFDKGGYKMPGSHDWLTGYSSGLSTSTASNVGGYIVRTFVPGAQELVVDGAPAAAYYWIEINVFGAVSMSTNTAPMILALAAGVPRPEAPWLGFNNPDNVRGILISQYGTQLYLNNALDFQ